LVFLLGTKRARKVFKLTYQLTNCTLGLGATSRAILLHIIAVISRRFCATLSFLTQPTETLPGSRLFSRFPSNPKWREHFGHQTVSGLTKQHGKLTTFIYSRQPRYVLIVRPDRSRASNVSNRPGGKRPRQYPQGKKKKKTAKGRVEYFPANLSVPCPHPQH